MALSFPITPMKAVLGALPPDDGEWAFEIKWDGFRTVAFVEDATVRLQSSGRRDVTSAYPELHALAGAVNATTAILDGELVVFDQTGRPNFGLMQRHGHEGVPQAVFMAFDLLSIEGHDVTELPFQQRHQLLSAALEPADNWRVSSYRVGGGADLFDAAAEQGLEGIMAKRLDSVYRPGTRSPAWRKVKVRRRLDVEVGGFTEGTGNRSGTFGALLVGLPDGDRLSFAGGVGTGFDQTTLGELTTRLRAMHAEVCPFDPPPPPAYRRGAHWVSRGLRAEITLSELTNDGLVRHASFERIVV